MPPARIIADRLHAWCKSEESYTLLDSTQATGATWTSGGCGLLACAMVRIFAESQLIGIFDESGRIHHLVALFHEKRAVFVDADGASAYARLISRWRHEVFGLGAPLHTLCVRVCTQGDAFTGGIPSDDADVDRVEAALRVVFSDLLL